MKSVRVSSLLATLLLAVTCLLLYPDTREWLLEGLGRVLVANESLTSHPDLVVVGVDAGGAGALEAADLVKSGSADRVAIFGRPQDKVAAELTARGVPVVDPTEVLHRQLIALKVPSVITLPSVTGTEDQGRVLREWCQRQRLESVLVVTSWHHSQRSRRIFRRAMQDRSTLVTIRVARYADFAPDDWWHDRDGLRTVVVELQKLAFDFLRHPLS